ncbi:MAG: hypothetical protein A2V65_09015 [Deltaproteobacteria bacterium RBG_13_49_15]|nr:MAG: hypothetical protein A2V65_09015 [Deltaproteobacteria bacterium RBG_13_49_15]
MDCIFFVGTSGYSYTEWMEAGFYPDGTTSGRMLPLYAQIFSVTELNYTWYQMPRAEAVERQRRLVPPSFLFAAKLTRTLTHEIAPDHWKEEAARYREGVSPLIQSGQLAAVLIQLPPSFTRTSEHRKHLAGLIAELHGLPLAIEFRHRSWVSERVFGELAKRQVTLVGVDGPDLPELFPALDVITNSDLIYIRFHGRNAKGWRSGKMSQQFDYTYSDEELAGWIEQRIIPMAKKAKKGIVFFNNHVRAQAPENARRMIRLLKEQGLTAA